MKLLLYCTKTHPYFYKSKSRNGLYILQNRRLDSIMRGTELNGKIVAECDFKVEEIVNSKLFNNYETWELGYRDLLSKSNLTENEIVRYLGTQNILHKVYKRYSCNCGYAIHIKNLHIFDEPKELNDYCRFDENGALIPITKAPQNMMYATQHLGEPMYVENHYIGLDDYFEDYILISIRPEWLCKILNKEKTIEVRRKVLNEML